MDKSEQVFYANIGNLITCINYIGGDKKMQDIVLPDGYCWEPKKGLYRLKQQKKIVNAIPVVVSKKVRKFCKNNQSPILMIGIQFVYQDNSRSEIIYISEKQLRSKDFNECFPIEVVIQPRSNQIVQEVFRVIIQEQLSKIEAMEETVYEFGWNGSHYYWDEGQETEVTKEYKSVVDLANLINSSEVIAGVVLAALHGPLVHKLKQAGINHNFVTFVVGETGVGKTEVVKKICNYLLGKNIFLSLGSDGRAIKKQIYALNDITLIIDDFCKSDSPELQRKNVKNVSDIIQNASDSGQVLINGTEILEEEKNIHLIITGEKVIKNFSTLNRCFVINMDEMLSEETWTLLNSFSDSGEMYIFMKSFIGWIEREGVNYINKMGVNYQNYLKDSQSKLNYEISGINRIRNTVAVNMTIEKALIDFLTQQGIDDRLLSRVKQMLQSYVWKSGKEICESIQVDIAKSRKMRYLPAMADILISIGNEFRIAKDINQYSKYKNFDKKGRKCIGVCLHDGYWSVEPKILCRRLEEFLDEENITLKSIAVELKEYSLALADCEGKFSCIKWGSSTRMYHIKVEELIELIYPLEGYGLLVLESFKTCD